MKDHAFVLRWAAVLVSVLLMTAVLPVGQVQAGPVAPEITITVTPTQVTPAQAGLLIISGPYPLEIEAELDGQPLPVFWTGEVYMATISFGFEEPAGIKLLNVEARDPLSGAAAELSQEMTVTDFRYPLEQVALPFSLTPLLDRDLNQREVDFLHSIYAVQSPQAGLDWPFTVPVTGGVITSRFGGDRIYNAGVLQSYHTGTDFRRGVGDPVIAAADGTVVLAQLLDVRGNVIVLDHGWGVYSQYAHLSSFLVQPGQFVQQGETIALGGATGRTNGPHLHFEVIIGGHEVDPMRFMQLTPDFIPPREIIATR